MQTLKLGINIPEHPDFYSIKQVAFKLGISRISVRRQILKGKIQAYRVGGLGYIIPKSQFN
jgi:excisionase family DNA binding protein